MSRSELCTNAPTPRFTNVYVKSLPKEIGEDELRKLAVFRCAEAAVQAVEKMNGISLGDDVLFVGRAQKKSE
ncbi:hypothetical protein Bca4012_030319 [Brassica carinata]